MARIYLILLATLISTTGWAQTTPRVLVIFDTSGSMLWDYTGENPCYGDGSDTYPHTNAACQLGSRLFHAKSALSRIIQNSPNTEFGLMRYGQLEPGDAGFGQSQHEVGAQYRRADRSILDSNYDGSTNGCGPADRLVDPSPASRGDVLAWMDGVENYPGDKELRANGFTPLTDSMQSATQTISQLIADDAEADCRPYYVLLLTDGYQQCPGADAADPNFRRQIANELTGIADGLRDLSVLGQRHDVRTFVVGFGPGTAFATELDQLARAGGTAVDANGQPDLLNGTAYQANDPANLAAVLADAVNNARPREICDGIDNDCDGAIDEDFAQLGRACEVGNGACASDGRVVCDPNGDGTICSAEEGDQRAEVCDGIDNDCDGQTDEGLRNRCGDCGAEPDEICNDLDDDCDNAIDEGLLNACGSCGRLPVEVCNARDDDCDGRTDEGVTNACDGCGQVPVEVCNCEDDDCDNRIDEGLTCPACNCTPVAEQCNNRDDDCDNEIDEDVLNRCAQCGAEPEEICNGLDDDCDGSIDESFPERGQPCGDGIGECREGERRCIGGRLECAGGALPRQELCDGLDNDCDGTADEDALNACGWCGPGRLEVCDNIDNDCDGTADQAEVLCRDPKSCFNGECAEPCESGECFNGRVCVQGHCLTPCRNRECPDGWVCDDGECGDPCIGIECPDETYCTLGRCVADDCYGPGGCGRGRVCTNGRCIDDPCATANCGPDQGCLDGVCIDPCANQRCTDGTICVNGDCVVDACARVTCPFPQICDNGRCQADDCFEVDCPLGHMCQAGACVDDPCGRIVCPGNALCRRGRCADPGSGVGYNDDPDIPVPTGGTDAGADQAPPVEDGCYCDASGGGEPLGWLGLLGLLGLLRRRRVREATR
jgi:uncharacterized protein (TIGR03382 family)